MTEYFKVNLNDTVKVRLTDLGKEIYYHRYDNLNQRVGKIIIKPTFPEEDEEGYTQFQLWDFINLYGNHIGMTKPNVIEPLNIVFEDEESISALMESATQMQEDEAFEIVEVRHGRWHRFMKGSGLSGNTIILSDAFQCTVCKESFWNKSNYCPNCGAKMDGGQDDV